MGPARYGRQTKKVHEPAILCIADTCWKKFVCVNTGLIVVLVTYDWCELSQSVNIAAGCGFDVCEL